MQLYECTKLSELNCRSKTRPVKRVPFWKGAALEVSSSNDDHSSAGETSTKMSEPSDSKTFVR
jgi:hypothetical protein